MCGLGVSRRIKQKKVHCIPKKPQHVFSRVRPDHPRCRSATWICECGHTRDPVIYSKFHRNPFRGFRATGGQNLAFPITLACRFYNSLYYRTSRDSDCCCFPPCTNILTYLLSVKRSIVALNALCTLRRFTHTQTHCHTV